MISAKKRNNVEKKIGCDISHKKRTFSPAIFDFTTSQLFSTSSCLLWFFNEFSPKKTGLHKTVRNCQNSSWKSLCSP